MAKQVIIQRVRDAEKENIYNEYKDRKGEIINGVVRRFERGNLIVDLGRAEAILPIKEQIPREKYNVGDRIRGFILDVKKSTTSPQIVMSRASVEFLAKLFEMEVPEIYEGVVQIRHAAREPGSRAKIAVVSYETNVDPVGACVGMKGSRVQAVVSELRGEKIDIIEYSENPAKFVCNALAPADILKVIIDEDNRTMDVIVADDQLSLAIGKRGQNVRLAAKLSQWRINIHSENQYKELEESGRKAFARIPEINDTLLDLLIRTGYKSLEDLADATVEDLMAFPSVDEDLALAIMDRAYDLYQEEEKRKKEAADRGEVIELGARRSGPAPTAEVVRPADGGAVAAQAAPASADEAPAVDAASAPPKPPALPEIYTLAGIEAHVLKALDDFGCHTKEGLLRLVRDADGTALFAVPGLGEDDIEVLREYVLEHLQG
jgi:N utilization substance protein A